MLRKDSAPRPALPRRGFSYPNRGPRIRITRDDMKNFKVGDKVKWISCSNGSCLEKKGVVEAVVPAHCDPVRIATLVADRYGIRNISLVSPRDEDSYIVRVPTKTGKVGKLYWPLVAALEANE